MSGLQIRAIDRSSGSDVNGIGEEAFPQVRRGPVEYLHFALGDTVAIGPEAPQLPPGHYEDPEWKARSLTALATGAFPGALAPRKLSRRVA